MGDNQAFSHDLGDAALALLATALQEIDLPPGGSLLRPGEAWDALYVVCAGTLDDRSQVSRAAPPAVLPTSPMRSPATRGLLLARVALVEVHVVLREEGAHIVGQQVYVGLLCRSRNVRHSVLCSQSVLVVLVCPCCSA